MKKRSSWDSKINKAEKFLRDAHEHGRKVYQRYKDERKDRLANLKRVNLFYSNVNTVKESLFNSMPKLEVNRIQKGNYNDDVARVAALIVQRGLTYEVTCADAFEESINAAILERLVPGIGQVWVSFKADTDEQMNPIDGTESIKVESIYWEDFLYEPCKLWSKCGWVGRRKHLSKDAFIKAYGEENFRKIGEAWSKDSELSPQAINQDKICVYEIWDKRSKKVYHISKGLDKPLKEMDDPYKLKGFFPCPRPLIANVDTTAFLPVTDYHLAQDQYIQLDTLYARIDLIVEAIKVAGAYDASNTAIGKMLEGGENKLIPVDNWAMYAEKGGARGLIDWYPVEQVVTVLQQLYAAFEATKAMLYEITGMSDIVRGASNQYETAAAQQIKAEFASVRLNGYQRDVSEFVRDTLRIMGEMFCQLYSPEKITQIIGNLDEPDQAFMEQAMQTLQDDLLMHYKIDIQANSLTQADWALEKEQRMEVVQVLGQMIGQVQELITNVPEMAMLGVQLIKFAIAGYKAGVELEGWLDQQLDAMLQKQQQEAQNPTPPEPSAEEKKAEADMQKMQMEAQLEQQKMQMEMQFKQMEMQLKQQMMQFEMQHKQQMAQLELQIRQLELAMKQEEHTLKLQSKREEAALNAEVAQTGAALDIQAKQASHEQKLAQAAETAAAKPEKGADK